MKIRDMLAVLIPGVVLCSALVACGNSSGDGSDGVAVAAGEALAESNACGSCHSGSKGTLAGGDTRQGGVYGPNLTPDMKTGIGGWTDDQIKTALKSGKDDEGESLCATMPLFSTMSDEDLTNIVAYLRSLPAVSNTVPDGDCED